jgi:hypothetical protein
VDWQVALSLRAFRFFKYFYLEWDIATC